MIYPLAAAIMQELHKSRKNNTEHLSESSGILLPPPPTPQTPDAFSQPSSPSVMFHFSTPRMSTRQDFIAGVPPFDVNNVNSGKTSNHDSQVAQHQTADNELLQRIPSNDSGLVLELSQSASLFQDDPETVTSNLSPNLMIPPVQSPFLGSNKAPRLPSVSMAQKFQEMKVANHDQQDVPDKKSAALSQPPPDMVQGRQKMDLLSFSSHSEDDHDNEVRSSLHLQRPIQEDLIEIPDNTPQEVQEYVQKLRKERDYWKQRATKVERAWKQRAIRERDARQKWCDVLVSHYDAKINQLMQQMGKIAVRNRIPTSEGTIDLSIAK